MNTLATDLYFLSLFLILGLSVYLFVALLFDLSKEERSVAERKRRLAEREAELRSNERDEF